MVDNAYSLKSSIAQFFFNTYCDRLQIKTITTIKMTYSREIWSSIISVHSIQWLTIKTKIYNE